MSVADGPRVAVVGVDPLRHRSTPLIERVGARLPLVGTFRPHDAFLFDVVTKLRHVHRQRHAWRARAFFNEARWNAYGRDIAEQVAATDAEVILHVYPVLFAAPRDRPSVIYTDNTMAVTQAKFPEWTMLSRRERVRAVERERDAFLAASFVGVTGEQARQSALEDYGCEPERVVLAGQGLLLPAPEVAPVREEALPPVAIFVATSFERKGGATLLEAWRTVERTLPDARLRIVGPKGPPRGLPASCSWEGPTDRASLPAAYLGARVFVLPTHFESSLPNAIREAMAHALPVVATRVDGIVQSFPDERWLVPVGDAEALAARLLELLVDPPLARAVGERNHAVARERFDWDAVTDRVVALLRAAAG